MKKEYLYPATALFCAIVIALGLVGVQYMKQSSIESQKRMELNHEKELALKESLDESYRKIDLNRCLDGAETAYWDYVELNMTEKDDGSYWGAQYKWDEAQNRKDKIEDKCFKQYK